VLRVFVAPDHVIRQLRALHVKRPFAPNELPDCHALLAAVVADVRLACL
jgi:hypothetical protein